MPAARPDPARPHVLFLACHLPWPALSGGRRRELELIRRVSERFEIHLLVVSKTAERDQANADVLRRWCRHVEVFAAAAAPRDARPMLGASDLSAAQRAAQPPQVLRHQCPAASSRVAEILADERVDLIHVEGFYLMQHIPESVRTPLLLVEQNVEYELERQRAVTAADPDGFIRFSRTAAAERECWARATRLAAVTAQDARMIEAAFARQAVLVVPDGADHVPNMHSLDGDRRMQHPGLPLIVLLANFGYAPNVDAAAWLCEEILPRVRARVPDVRLWLVGDAPPPEVRALHDERVIVTGQVADVWPYLDVADLVVCPLRIGGGIKVKTIEALRRGKAIVSTSIGAQGLPAQAREALVIADDQIAFAGGIASLLNDPCRRAELERRAARAARQLPSWDDAASALADAYDGLLQRAPAHDLRRPRPATAGAML